MKKGFTLIELMIVVAIIAIIAAIAIPNLMQSRKAANESNAIAALKTYGTAQTTYKNANYSQLATTGAGAGLSKWFASLYINLYSDVDGGGTPARLISEPFFNADSTTYAAAGAFQGYFFTDLNIAAISGVAGFWNYDFGLFADPASYSKSGTNSYYVGSDGVAKMWDSAAGAGAAGAGANASDPSAAPWTTV